MTTFDPDLAVLSEHARTKIADLRALIDWLEQRPLLAEKIYTGSTFYALAHTPNEWRAMLGELGTFDKSATDAFINAERHFGMFKFEVCARRESVCRRVKIGERTVEREVYPDDVKPTIVPETEDVYEWECPPSWLEGDDGAS